MKMLFTLDTLLGLIIAFILGWVASAFFLGYYEQERHPLTERSEENDRLIRRSVTKCSFAGAFLIAVLWLFHRMMSVS